MREELTRIGLLGLVAIATPIVFSATTQSFDFTRHDENLQSLRELERIEARLMREIGFQHTAIGSRNAEVVQSLAALQDVVRRLSENGLKLQPGSSEGVVAEVEAYSALVAKKQGLLRSYAEILDQYRGAVQAIPRSAQRFEKLGLDEDAVLELQREMISFLCELESVGSSPQQAELDIGPLLGRLAWYGQGLGPQGQEILETASEQLSSVLEARNAVDGLINDVLADPLSWQSEKIAHAYDVALSASIRSSDRYRIYLTVFVLALFVKIAHYMFSMGRSAKELKRTQQTLEQRVKDRTTQLVKANQELQNEIAERRKAEVDTQHARVLAEAASQTKSEFLANMSHEIRTPMTAILGFSERLLEPSLEEDDREEAIDTIRRNGEYLLQIINDILDLSKIEAGKLQLERITILTTDVSKGVEQLLRERAEDKGLNLSVEYVGQVPEFIETDPVRLRQILVNLVGNAIKFTRTGGVLIRIECVQEQYSMRDRFDNEFTGIKPFLRYSVIDTGIGMTDDQMSTLFTPFTQADSSMTRRFGGTGLGLSICRSLCELLGGRIDVVSSLGQGSRFTFTIDAGRLQGVRFIEPGDRASFAVPALPTRAFEESVDKECRVLLAEDGIDNQRLLRYLLERSGATVTIVGNGQQALNHALSGFVSGDPYDVVLMDMQMPVMDGYTAVRELRSAGYDRPIVALTAHAMATDREKCLSVGCDEFCPKPVDRSELVSILNRFMRQSTTRRDHGAQSTVESDDMFDMGLGDDPEMLELIEMFISDLQADVVVLKAACERSDFEKIATVSHQIKGCAGGYGFPAISEQAAVVEQLARDDVDPMGLEKELDRLVSSCQALKKS